MNRKARMTCNFQLSFWKWRTFQGHSQSRALYIW